VQQPAAVFVSMPSENYCDELRSALGWSRLKLALVSTIRSVNEIITNISWPIPSPHWCIINLILLSTARFSLNSLLISFAAAVLQLHTLTTCFSVSTESHRGTKLIFRFGQVCPRYWWLDWILFHPFMGYS
jgi:hypothetical protein